VGRIIASNLSEGTKGITGCAKRADEKEKGNIRNEGVEGLLFSVDI